MPEAGDRELAEFRKVIKLHQDAGLYKRLDELALAKRFVSPIPSGKPIEIGQQWLGDSRGIARLCRARMHFAALDNDQTEFVRAAAHALAIADICKAQAMVIDQLVGGAIDALVFASIREGARDNALSQHTCRELLALLSSRGKKLDVFRGIDAERLWTRDVVEWTHSDDGNGDGRHLPVSTDPGGSFAPSSKPPPRFNIENLASIGKPTKKQTTQALDEFYAVSRKLAHATLRERATMQTPAQYLDTLPKKFVVVKVLGPSLERYIKVADRIELELAGTRITLALELHNMSHSGYPLSLSVLDPPLATLHIPGSWMPEIVYKRFQPGEDPAPPGTRPYLLYWIGLDNTDDHGTVTGKYEDGSEDAWNEKASGCDFVFNAAKPLPKPPDPDDEPE